MIKLFRQTENLAQTLKGGFSNLEKLNIDNHFSADVPLGIEGEHKGKLNL